MNVGHLEADVTEAIVDLKKKTVIFQVRKAQSEQSPTPAFHTADPAAAVNHSQSVPRRNKQQVQQLICNIAHINLQ